jgi:hypothetical protein
MRVSVDSTIRAALVAGAALAFLAACSDDPAAPIPGGGDPENISRVTVTLTPVAGGTAQTSVRVDPDGTQLPQPVGAAQGTLAVTKGTTYNGTITLLNDLDPGNVINITDEVEDEGNFHRFFYTFSCTGVTVSNLNTDTQAPPAPLGTTFQVAVAAAAASTTTCTVRVELRHWESGKGDGTGSNFETDLDITFPVTIS